MVQNHLSPPKTIKSNKNNNEKTTKNNTRKNTRKNKKYTYKYFLFFYGKRGSGKWGKR
jgi:hypothetical protein